MVQVMILKQMRLPFEINASEGDWHWLDGKDIDETISDFDPEFNAMWLGGIEPSNGNKDFGMDWSTAEGNWTDANEPTDYLYHRI